MVKELVSKIRKAMGVLELPLGTIEKTNTKTGDFLNITNFSKKKIKIN